MHSLQSKAYGRKVASCRKCTALEVAALLGHRLPGYNVTETYATADPNHMDATKLALDKLLRAVCVPVISAKLERAKGFEPSTLTLAT